MYSLLIVDDENWVRQGLRLSIDWGAEGIEVIGEAGDGEEALRLIDDRRPDIVITDIRMPGLDGLALIEHMLSRKQHSKVIIISGYSDFTYAVRALKYGASDYILKPIEETALIASVRKSVRELQSERKVSGYIRESLPLARQHYLEKLLSGDKPVVLNRQSLWETLHIDLDPVRLRVAAVQIIDWGEMRKDASEKDRSLIRYALGNIAQEVGLRGGKTLACPMGGSGVVDVVVLDSPPLVEAADGARPARYLTELIEAARQYLNIRIAIGISRARGIEQVSRSFEEALQAGAYAFYDGYGRVYDAARLPLPAASAPQPSYKGPEGWETRFALAVKIGLDAMLRELAEELARDLEAARGRCSPYALRQGVVRLLEQAGQKLADALDGCTKEEIRARLTLPYCTLSELPETLIALGRRCSEACGGTASRRRVIELALQYTDARFCEGITMNSVAEHLYLNPSYFSKIFHEEMNETFSKYLTRLRMRKAKQLLKESTLRVYEIAQQVGYNDFRHFAKTFKELEGMTPARYRDSGIR